MFRISRISTATHFRLVRAIVFVLEHARIVNIISAFTNIQLHLALSMYVCIGI